MNSLALSVYFAMAVIALGLWVVIVANRSPPTTSLAPGPYAGADTDSVTKAWAPRAWFGRKTVTSKSLKSRI